jgi:hypothetical protein
LDRPFGRNDVRGGAPGTTFTDALRLDIRERRLDGVVFSGAATGRYRAEWTSGSAGQSERSNRPLIFR